MTGIAFCRKPRLALARPKLMRWALGGRNRRGQDKARKVRAVGRGGEHLKIPAMRQTLRNIGRTLRYSGTRYGRSTFDTL